MDKICLNCNSFFQDIKESEYILEYAAFAPFVDEITENAGFLCCRELYQKKRLDGARERSPADKPERRQNFRRDLRASSRGNRSPAHEENQVAG